MEAKRAPRGGRLGYYVGVAFGYARHPSNIGVEIAYSKRRRQVMSPQDPLPAASHDLPVVVSLTSYGARIQRVHVAIRSIMAQTVRPNEVHLWLGEDANGIELPQCLLELQELGLRIHRGVEDLKGHKKYFFAMRELQDCLLVTIDDDLMFPADAIESLLEAHAQAPDCVVARRTHRAHVVDGVLAPYMDWEYEFTEDAVVPRRSLVATTGAGTLYPPHTFAHLVGRPEDIRSDALLADDLWLKGMELAAGIPVAFAPNSQPMPFVSRGTQRGEMLAYDNVAGGLNDQALQRIMARFSLVGADFDDNALRA